MSSNFSPNKKGKEKNLTCGLVTEWNGDWIHGIVTESKHKRNKLWVD